jgi:hypothetical protein
LAGFPKNLTIQQILDSIAEPISSSSNNSTIESVNATESEHFPDTSTFRIPNSNAAQRPSTSNPPLLSPQIKSLSTPDKLEYKWFPACQNRFVFKISAAHDAHLAFTSHNYESDPMLEVFIGGWANTKSVIRKNRTKPDVVEKSTPGILSSYDYRGFWVQWSNDIISVGRAGEGRSFMSHNIDEHFPINFVGVCTGWLVKSNF